MTSKQSRLEEAEKQVRIVKETTNDIGRRVELEKVRSELEKLMLMERDNNE